MGLADGEHLLEIGEIVFEGVSRLELVILIIGDPRPEHHWGGEPRCRAKGTCRLFRRHQTHFGVVFTEPKA